MIKGALIGCGRHGLRFIEGSKTINGLIIGAVVDRNPETAKNIRDIKFYNDLGKMLTDYEPNLVIISTNGPSHYEIARKVIDHGVKMLIISKPLTTSYYDAVKLHNLIKSSDIRIAVDHALRYDKTYKWIRNNIDNQKWGEVLQVNIDRSGIGLGCLATHSFDLANYIFGYFPTKVTGWVDKPVNINPRGSQFIDPGGTVVLNYKNDKKAVISQIENTIRGVMMVTIYMQKCTIKVDVKNQKLVIESFDAKGNKIININPHEDIVNHDLVFLMKQLMIDIIGSRKLIADFKYGMEAIKILIAAYASNENGNIPIQLEESKILKLDQNLPVT